VLYVADALHDAAAGGTERQLSYLLAHLDRRRITPHLAVFRATSFAQAASRHLCETRVLRIRRLRHPASAARLMRLAFDMRARRIRVAHVFFNDASVAAPAFCRIGGAQVLVSRRDMGFWYTPSVLRALRLSNRFVSRMVANSQAVADNVTRREGYSAERIDVVPNGLDVPCHAVPARDGLRGRLGIRAGDPVIGMVAHFHPWKRHADVVRAFARVLQAHPNAHLVFAGAGRTESEVRALAAAVAADRVHFLGAVDDAVSLMRSFTVGVLCSDSEGSSNVVLEYLACGAPVVCTDVGGNAELVEEGVSGFLVRPGDVAALADRIIGLLADPAAARRIGARGRASAQRFSMEAMVDRHMELYEQLAEAPQ
jgi:L-malate glycosyltransferase